MKIDRRRPSHWLYLVLMGLMGACALILRKVLPSAPQRRPLIVLYGHKLSGNLLALYRHVRARCPNDWQLVFLTMDPAYCRRLRAEGFDCTLAIAPSAVWLLAKAAAIVSDHGLHSLRLLLGRSDLLFFDVWHGIPFKGFDQNDFRIQRRYDEAWVASPLLAHLYIEKFGFAQDRVQVTGYARTDRLVNRREDPIALRSRLGLPPSGRIVLFAPTWVQDDAGRSLFPFGVPMEAFLRELSGLAVRTSAIVVVRPHLNSGAFAGVSAPNVMILPSSEVPDTEAVLMVSDVLVCDWSSLAFDFLLLGRPTIFLDVPAPFRKGFSLDPKYRFGVIADDMQKMLSCIERSLQHPGQYWEQHGAMHERTLRAVYGGSADGHAAERCLQRLSSRLSSP